MRVTPQKIIARIPPGIGDNGTWVPHAVRTISEIAAGGSEAVAANWYPRAGEHTCLKVAAETQIGEIDTGDNSAQENVFVFNTAGSSSHEPIFFEVKVQNPLSRWALINLRPQGLRLGWETTVEHGWLWLPPRGEKMMKVALFTDLNRSRPLSLALRRQKQDAEIRPNIDFRLEGAVYTWYGEGPNIQEEPEHLESIGSIHVKAKARRLMHIDLGADRNAAREGVIIAGGRLDVPLQGVGVKLEVSGPDKRHRVVSLQTDAQGAFAYDSRKAGHGFKDGVHTLQAFIVDDPVAADTESDIVRVDVKATVVH